MDSNLSPKLTSAPHPQKNISNKSQASFIIILNQEIFLHCPMIPSILKLGSQQMLKPYSNYLENIYSV